MVWWEFDVKFNVILGLTISQHPRVTITIMSVYTLYDYLAAVTLTLLSDRRLIELNKLQTIRLQFLSFDAMQTEQYSMPPRSFP